MCGIFGVINFNGQPVDKDKVLSARDILAHRGPDDAGIYFTHCYTEDVTLSLSKGHTDSRSSHTERSRSMNNNNYTVALAHRRLSIIDLSPAAHQPMISEDGRFIIVYNGEIYNYKSLILFPSPKEMSGFKSNSDTEVILKLYAEYGKDCLSMLRGMFAFAIWDDNEKTLFAARDRFGIKPFYYYFNESDPLNGETSFVFSSELNAIKHYKNDLTISNQAVDAYLKTGSVPAPLTIYNEVKALLPGHYLEIKADPSSPLRVTIRKYWEFSDLFEESAGQNAHSSMFNDKSLKNMIPTTSKLSTDLPSVRLKHSTLNIQHSKLVYDNNAKQKIKAALLDSIRAHMVSDVEVGAFLSGGIDSTAIVSLMRQVGKEKIKTVSIVFPDSKFDESRYSRLASRHYKTEHIEIPFYEKDLLEDFDKIMSVMDQPTIDGINTYFVSKAAKQAGLKVVLSGLGGDELFGGYPSFNLLPKFQRIKNLPFAKMFMKAAAPLLKNRLPAKAIAYMKNPDEPNAEYKLLRGLFTDDELRNLGWNSYSHQSSIFSQQAINDSMTNDYLPPFTNHRHPEPVEGSLIHVAELETTFYMRNQLLRDSDVFSMAHSIELRVPFVDHLLYEAVLPYLDNGYDKKFPKKMLVEAVGDLPDEIVQRPKMGFTFPFEEWIKNGKLKNEINESINTLNSHFNLSTLSFDLEKLHWSRVWALYILTKFIN